MKIKKHSKSNLGTSKNNIKLEFLETAPVVAMPKVKKLPSFLIALTRMKSKQRNSPKKSKT